MNLILTQQGYALGEVVSALQKEIRRGKERSAMYWAMELIPRFEQYMWRRLASLMYSGLLRVMESFSNQAAWNNPCRCFTSD